MIRGSDPGRSREISPPQTSILALGPIHLTVPSLSGGKAASVWRLPLTPI